METRNADLSSLRIDRSNKEDLNPGRKKLFVGIVIIFILLVAIYLIYNFVFSSSVSVKLTTAVLQKPGQTASSLTASGYVVAQRKASIASKGTGRLVYLGVVEGDKVKKNQVIGQIENDDIKAQLEEAKANLKLNEADLINAENVYLREKELLAKGLTSKQIFDQAEANYKRSLAAVELAKARIKQIEVALENTFIRAPFDGTVLTKNAEVGEVVAPLGAGTNIRGAVVTIADMNSLLVEADVSESNIERILVNQDCEIILDAYPEKSYQGFVFKIVPTADRSKATVMVKVGFKEYDSRVLPEMSAKVSFFTEPVDTSIINQKPLLVIPVNSICQENGKYFIFKVVEGSARKFEVTIGQRFDTYVEILSGLRSGDQIIDSLTDKVQDGIKVKISD
ncbi:MAG: efflux RND transporter periplasmic adaptor subunit [Ignavibacteriaceae bacterium]|nr:efflux RND transporter periplasmic adaptor subunit [Ignavibacteriaceae bacterium]